MSAAIEKFMTRVAVQPNDCWLWQGAVNSSGYSYTTIGGDSLRGVHIRAYELMVGPVPNGKELHHLCEQKQCCNPAHMEVVSHYENQQRHRSTTEQERRVAVGLARQIGTSEAARQVGVAYSTLRKWGAPPSPSLFWTRERVIDAIRDYADQYGHPPSARDWSPAMARGDFRDDVADRFYEDGCWPGSNTVMNRFGSWNAAIAAAGFAPLPQGRKYVDGPPPSRRFCVGCGDEFQPKTRRSRYCSRPCYNATGIRFASQGGLREEAAA